MAVHCTLRSAGHTQTYQPATHADWEQLCVAAVGPPSCKGAVPPSAGSLSVPLSVRAAPTLHMRKLRLRGVICLVQGHSEPPMAEPIHGPREQTACFLMEMGKWTLLVRNQ